MQLVQVAHPAESRVRFVFDDGVVSMNLAADAVFADVARIADELAAWDHGIPIAIDVTVAASSTSLGPSQAQAIRAKGIAIGNRTLRRARHLHPVAARGDTRGSAAAGKLLKICRIMGESDSQLA